jgi:hypothetical protein
VWAVVPLEPLAGEQIVFFKNGRALRVLDSREEGEWVYLVISEPKDTGKMTDAQKRAAAAGEAEDVSREIGVRASTIDRVENATGGGAITKKKNTSRTANGVVSDPGSFDGTSGSRGYVVKELTPDEIARRKALNPEPVPNTPAMGSGASSPEAIAQSNAALDSVDLSKTLAGGEQRINSRNLKVPSYILNRAKQVQAQRQQDRAAKRLAMRREQAAAAAAPEAEAPAADSDPPTEPER